MDEPLECILWLLLLLFLVLIADGARRIFKLQSTTTRRFVHVVVALAVPWAPFLFHDAFYPELLGLILIVVNFLSLRFGMFKGINVEKNDYGTVYYPASFFIFVVLLWNKEPFVVSIAMLVMGLGDPAAAIVGTSLHDTHRIPAFGEHKKLEGSVTMFVVSSISVFVGLTVLGGYFPALAAISIYSSVSISLSIGIMVAAVELVSPRATDNLSVPLVAGLLAYTAVTTPSSFEGFIVGELLAALVAIVSYRLKFLSSDGAFATFIAGSFIFGFGGWEWAIPILTFFVIGTVSSKLYSRRKAAYNLLYEEGPTRDSGQVFANGGVGLLTLVGSMLAPNHHWFLAYVGSLAAVTADTVATELGVFSRRDPFSPTAWQRVAKGTSGGISLYGSAAGLIGVASLSALALPLAGVYSLHVVRFIAVGAISGAVGSLADSILGGTIQAQYRCPACGKTTEKKKHCDDNGTKLTKGYRWVNNDVVNFAASLIGAVTMPMIFK